MRVVFDTNIYISAFVVPGSQAEKAIIKIVEGDDILIISKDIIDEILSVLAFKFSKDREFISRTALFLAEIARIAEPSRRVDVFKDGADNKVLECALAGRANAVFTGDQDMLACREFEGIKIISLKEYL